jgi:glyoxylase-like metal-dependent hydrolase (beta-lactamase superfamily II)
MAVTTAIAASAAKSVLRPRAKSPEFKCEPNLGAEYSARNPGVPANDADPKGVIRIRAANPSPLTLDGTNTYVVGSWVVDPGPADVSHLDAVRQVLKDSIEGVVLTHSHADHAEGAELLGAPVTLPRDGETVGPFRVVGTPGHSVDSVCLLFGRACFTGDTVLGQGSVFIAPGEGSLSAYLDSLRRLRDLDLEVLCPGHGPYIWDPAAKLDEYIAHRLDRERRLVEALDAGVRTRDELLEAAWSDVPPDLRAAAALTLAAHLEKLSEEGRLPDDAG